MSVDNRYRNNLVITKDGFQNLLTNIKNYPIIDIDFVTENENDLVYQDNVWLSYMDGTPCLKVTYGDERSTKGNIIFSEDLRIQLRQKERKLKELNELKVEWEHRRNRLIEIWQQNQNAYTSKIDQAKIIANNLIKIDTNKYNFLILMWKLLTAPSLAMFDERILSALQDIDGNDNQNYFTDSNGESIVGPQIFTYEVQTFNKETNESGFERRSFSITFKFLNDVAKNDLRGYISGMKGKLYEITENNEDEISLRKAKVFDDFIEFIDRYNNLTFQEEMNSYNLRISLNEDDKLMYEDDQEIPESVYKYLNFTQDDFNYNFNTFYEECCEDILNIIYDIGAKINENIRIIVERINEITIQLNWLLAPIGEKTPSTMIFGKDGDTDIIEEFNIAELEESILEDKESIERRSRETMHPTYGYKYVKLGTNIKFDENVPGKENYGVKINPTTGQANGTFRVNINNTLYEIGIKGFIDDGSEDNYFNGTAKFAEYDISEKNKNPNERLTIPKKFVKKTGDEMSGKLNINLIENDILQDSYSGIESQILDSSTINFNLYEYEYNRTKSSNNSKIGVSLDINLLNLNSLFITSNANEEDNEFVNPMIILDGGIEPNIYKDIDILNYDQNTLYDNIINDQSYELIKTVETSNSQKIFKPLIVNYISDTLTPEIAKGRIKIEYSSGTKKLITSGDNKNKYTYSLTNNNVKKYEFNGAFGYQKNTPLISTIIRNANNEKFEFDYDLCQINIPVIEQTIKGIDTVLPIRKISNNNEWIIDNICEDATTLNAYKDSIGASNNFTSSSLTNTDFLFNVIQQEFSNILFGNKDTQFRERNESYFDIKISSFKWDQRNESNKLKKGILKESFLHNPNLDLDWYYKPKYFIYWGHDVDGVPPKYIENITCINTPKYEKIHTRINDTTGIEMVDVGDPLYEKTIYTIGYQQVGTNTIIYDIDPIVNANVMTQAQIRNFLKEEVNYTDPDDDLVFYTATRWDLLTQYEIKTKMYQNGEYIDEDQHDYIMYVAQQEGLDYHIGDEGFTLNASSTPTYTFYRFEDKVGENILNNSKIKQLKDDLLEYLNLSNLNNFMSSTINNDNRREKLTLNQILWLANYEQYLINMDLYKNYRVDTMVANYGDLNSRTVNIYDNRNYSVILQLVKLSTYIKNNASQVYKEFYKNSDIKFKINIDFTKEIIQTELPYTKVSIKDSFTGAYPDILTYTGDNNIKYYFSFYNNIYPSEIIKKIGGLTQHDYYIITATQPSLEVNESKSLFSFFNSSSMDSTQLFIFENDIFNITVFGSSKTLDLEEHNDEFLTNYDDGFTPTLEEVTLFNHYFDNSFINTINKEHFKFRGINITNNITNSSLNDDLLKYYQINFTPQILLPNNDIKDGNFTYGVGFSRETYPDLIKWDSYKNNNLYNIYSDLYYTNFKFFNTSTTSFKAFFEKIAPAAEYSKKIFYYSHYIPIKQSEYNYMINQSMPENNNIYLKIFALMPLLNNEEYNSNIDYYKISSINGNINLFQTYKMRNSLYKQENKYILIRKDEEYDNNYEYYTYINGEYIHIQDTATLENNWELYKQSYTESIWKAETIYTEVLPDEPFDSAPDYFIKELISKEVFNNNENINYWENNKNNLYRLGYIFIPSPNNLVTENDYVYNDTSYYLFTDISYWEMEKQYLYKLKDISNNSYFSIAFDNSFLLSSSTIIGQAGYSYNKYNINAFEVNGAPSKFNNYVQIDTHDIEHAAENSIPIQDAASLSVIGSGFFTKSLRAAKVYNAVYNDYAECRKTIDIPPGYCVIDNNDGTLKLASQRLLPGAQVISDTYGNLMGETDECKTPLAVAGRVLVYPYQDKSKYQAGMCVCTAPGGTVDIMTREEIKNYPDCIVGIVSEIPNYQNWGTDNITVNNRIWIKVR